MTLIKKVKIDDASLDVIGAMSWEDGPYGFVGRIKGGQLDRKQYLAVNKGLDALGGKWKRSLKGHTFKTDPRPRIQEMLEAGFVEVARDGFFPTPHQVGLRMAELARIEPGMSVLEPSAGTGELAWAIMEVQPDCVLWVGEKNRERAKTLEKGHAVWSTIGDVKYDFLEYTQHGWDRIIQNPPFENKQDIDHVLHAYNLLRAGGVLVSVMGEGTFFREHHKDVNFRTWLYNTDESHTILLDAGTFKESGTAIFSRIVVVRKD